MDLAVLEEIRACLGDERTVFYYFRDRYAALLLEMAVGEGRSVQDLRRSPFAGLLNKPSVRTWLSRLGKSRIERRDVEHLWENPALAYRMTLGRWPLEGRGWSKDYHQMTRRGHNLVLQLNFPISHNRALFSLVGREDAEGEVCRSHPAAEDEMTLAWARLDIEMETGEALIEEIQSDWIRDVQFNAGIGRVLDRYRPWIRYADGPMQPYVRTWPETMLSAALWFLYHEMKVRRVFYHTYESGMRLKHLDDSQPPRSLYTELPRRFCFRRTHNGPLFLRDSKYRTMRKRLSEPKTDWFVLELPA